MIGDLQTTLFDRGLDRNMEFEADLTAMETAYRSGYGPNGMVEVLRSLERIQSQSTQRGSWYSTHPPLHQRINQCEAKLRQYGDWMDMAQLSARYNLFRKQIP
jgi:predicted Zn-dependent protease